VSLAALGFWGGYRLLSQDRAPEPPPVAQSSPPPTPRQPAVPAATPPTTRRDSNPTGDAGGSFLEAFGGKDAAADEKQAVVLGNDDLESRFKALGDTKERLKALVQRTAAGTAPLPVEAQRQAVKEREELVGQLDRDLATFEKDLARARQARPADPVPQWLTGELLILVGGEPEEMLPYLRRAIEGGLTRPRLFASLARVQIEANQFAPAFETATRALAGDSRDPYVWSAFARSAFALQKFTAVIDRVEEACPQDAPLWAAKMRLDAMQEEARWQVEQRLRRAEEKANSLPRVRLVIEHRRFARDPGGAATAKIETTGRGEVLLELFEDQAPNTVVNFLELTAAKSYDGTRFYLAEAAALVAGGDPKSRTGDAAADGTGGPGYTIPDEFQRPGARGHFRGSLGMVNTGPHTAGSQFYITLVPLPAMDGRFTVFGRVIEGQEVIDGITQGRTNREVGRFGRLIPGDLLVRAEVVRRRPHAHPVQKETIKSP
jgi:peptidyl-prolyl cis-trans isomerase B (cyclophilin B)